MHLLKYFFVGLVLLLSATTLRAQLPKINAFKNYSAAQGLPTNNISSVCEDSRGFLWLGSEEGLFRFDGSQFKSWYANASDSSHFSLNHTIVIGEYGKNQMLFNASGKIWTINTASFKVQPIERLRKLVVNSGMPSLFKKYWYLASSDSIYFLNKDLTVHDIFSVKKHFKSNVIIKCIELAQHKVLLFEVNGANKFLIYDLLGKRAIDLQLSATKVDPRAPYLIAQLFDSITNTLFCTAYFNGHFSSVINIDAGGKYLLKPIPFLTDGTLHDAQFIGDSAKIFASDNGLILANNNQMVSYTAQSLMPNKLSSNVIQQIYKSSKNEFWLSSQYGVSRFSLGRAKFQRWELPLSLASSNAIKRLLKWSKDEYYALGNHSGLFYINAQQQNVNFTATEGMIYLWDIAKQNGNLLIVGGQKKLMEYNVSTRTSHFPSYLTAYLHPKNDLITLIYQAKNGDMWYSSNEGGGLVRFVAASNTVQHFMTSQVPSPFSHRYVHSVAEDSKGNLYFGSNKNHNLLRWQLATQKFDEFASGTLSSILKHNTGIIFLHVDLADNVWLCLDGGGIVKYNFFTKASDYLDLNRGLPTAIVNSLCSDAKNRLWIKSEKGLSCFNPATNKVVTFTSNDDLPETNMSGDAIIFDQEDNWIVASAGRHVVRFNPDTILQYVNNAKPKVYIEDMLVNGKAYYFTDASNIQLKANENNISFNFASPDFERNEQLVFEYKINDGEWTAIAKQRNVTFNNLGAGLYHFTVRCRYLGAEAWSETEYPFQFTVANYWYKTWWFLSLMALAIAGLVFYAIRAYYTKQIAIQKAAFEQQRAVEAERNRIAADMHDDLGSGLTKITYLSQMAINSDNKDAELKRISDTSAALVGNMGEIIWAMKEENNKVEDFFLYLKDYALEYCGTNQLECLFHSPDEMPNKMIKGEMRRHLFLIFKELLHNIVKHANASKVTIGASCGKEWMISIKDDGCGMEENNAIEKKRTGGNGLKNISKRLELIGGRMETKNENGTLITLFVAI